VMALLYPMVLSPLISFFYHAAAYGKSPALYLIVPPTTK